MRAVLWMAPKMHAADWFMLQPAVQTLDAGFRLSGLTVSIGAGLQSLVENSSVVRSLSNADIFVWIGQRDAELIRKLLQRLTDTGVFTIHYRTEPPLVARSENGIVSFQGPSEGMPVREVWEYSKSSAALQSALHAVRPSKTWQKQPLLRYVPPGFIRQRLAAVQDESAQLVLLGSGSRYFPRYGCLHQIREKLESSQTHLWSNPPSDQDSAKKNLSAWCRYRFCMDPRCDSVHCMVKVVHAAFSEATWDEVVSRSGHFLNLHKSCNKSARASSFSGRSPPCESFRLAALLSAGARVISEHCTEEEEAEYAGLVDFHDVVDIPGAFIAARKARLASNASEWLREVGERRREFRRRMSVGAIFARAEIPQLVASLQAQHAASSRHSRAQNHAIETGGLNSALDELASQRATGTRCSLSRIRFCRCKAGAAWGTECWIE